MVYLRVEDAIANITKTTTGGRKMGVVTTHDITPEMQGIKKPSRGLYAPPNASTSKKKFWSINRLKVIVSATLPTLALYWIYPSFCRENNTVFFLIFGYMYLVAPLISGLTNKTKVVKVKTKEDCQKTGKPRGVYLEFGHKLYKRQQIHAGQNFIFFSLFLGFVIGILNGAYIEYTGYFLPKMVSTALPYIIYHILCFIGDYPLCFFKASAYAKTRSHNYSYSNSHFANHDYTEYSRHHTSSSATDYSNYYPNSSSSSISYIPDNRYGTGSGFHGNDRIVG